MSSLLSAAGAAPASRSASAVVAKPARGFHVFRVDGYSVTTTFPAGERITSAPFDVGGRCWLVDYYPNGQRHRRLRSRLQRHRLIPPARGHPPREGAGAGGVQVRPA
ncbi:unnamed protein product [Urochloa humidicola]